MLTAAILFDSLNSARDEYILAAGDFLGYGQPGAASVPVRKMGKIVRIALIAAIVATLLTVTAYAAGILGISNRAVPPVTSHAPEIGDLVDRSEAAASAVAGVKQWSLLAPVGDLNSPEAKAIAEWHDFYASYMAARNTEGERYRDWSDYEAAEAILGAYTALYSAPNAVMAQKLLDICEKYDLKLHTGEVFADSEEELYEILGTDPFLPEEGFTFAIVFEDGSYSVDGRLAVGGTSTDYDLMFTVAGTMPNSYLPVGIPDVAEFNEWNYVNSSGDLVCISQRKDAFEGYTDVGYTTFVFYDGSDACVYAYAVVPGGPENAEIFADSFCFAEAASGSREIETPSYRGLELEPEPAPLVPEGTEAQVLYILAGENVSYALQEAVWAFNEKNGPYAVAFLEYDEKGADPLKADIYDLNTINYVNYNKCAMLQDLKPFFQADKELPYADLLPEILAKLEQDGALYELTPAFGIETLAGYGSILGDVGGFTVDRLLELSEEYTPLALFGGRVTREEFFRLMLELDWNEYIDTSTATCRFDSESFVKLVDFSKGLNTEYDLGLATPDAYVYNGELLLRQVFVSNMPIDVVLYNDGMFHKDAVYPGFPSESGTGSALVFPIRLGMSQDSEHQEGAWEFFRFLLSEEYLTVGPDSTEDVWSSDYIPVRCSMLEQAMDYWRAHYEVRGSINMYGWEDLTIYSEPDDGTAADRVMELADRADGISWYDEEVLCIIMEEAETFYSGQATAEEATAHIQQHASAYLSRQKE